MRVLALVLMLVAGTATAAQRVYEGEEAAAIRCANMMAMTGVMLNGAGLMDTPQKDVLVGISVLILERHVGGNWTEKKRAMEAMRDRRGVEATLEDYQRNAPLCLKRFPIN
ncbi:hypothetical protein [Sulfitobacter guttiformis]|uniref:Uncharacterized protein n=1 Tax=Sulfitobacter guttiformis TaxID=74349 RepID=A0A420DNQ1_9RHOB|nr:hypothetical protein [Sulfitobacter guttiformis]KIN73118.1 hypothetical protein Z949_2301 [Sulfitobacter guttiformis KCTC 32187]RKE95803.1 hypothetical protein C8N30_0343 [Sulfitobacter guttiformis]